MQICRLHSLSQQPHEAYGCACLPQGETEAPSTSEPGIQSGLGRRPAPVSSTSLRGPRPACPFSLGGSVSTLGPSSCTAAPSLHPADAPGPLFRSAHLGCLALRTSKRSWPALCHRPQWGVSPERHAAVVRRATSGTGHAGLLQAA